MRSLLARALLTSLCILMPLLGGCSKDWDLLGSAIQLPGTTKLLDNAPRVENSDKSPCWQQKQIAAQNSYFASIKDGKETVYAAPCEAPPQVAKKKPAVAPAAVPAAPAVTKG